MHRVSPVMLRDSPSERKIMLHKFGKTIKLFLLDADPDGRMICELSNWTGKAYRIPRGKVKDCSDRSELKTTAVYLLFGKAARGAKASGKRVSDGFVIFKGSEIAKDTVPSFPKGFNTLRDELLENESIKEHYGKLTFEVDYLFSSPSAAAAVVMGRSANGLIEWKDKSGRDLKSIERKEIQKANANASGEKN